MTLKEKQDELQTELDKALVDLDRTKQKISNFRELLRKVGRGVEAETKLLADLESIEKGD